MKLFTVGPVEMYDSTLAIAGRQIPYFRTAEFSDMMKESEDLLKKLTFSEKDARAAFLTASGTGAMESSVTSCFDVNDKLLVISGGGFGRRFEEICEYHGIPFAALRLGFGEILTADMLEKYDGTGITGLLVNIHETTTGQLYDVRILSDFCRRNGAYLVVDAISSFLADELRIRDNGIDLAIISSQKALALSPGVSAVLVSPRMYEERVLTRKSCSYYLNLATHLKDMERGQTPFTPAVGTLIEMNAMLREVYETGVDSKISKTAELGKDFRRRLSGIGVDIPRYPLSNALTPMLFDGNAQAVFLALKDRGMTVTPTGGDLKDTLLRVGHMGNLTADDNRSLIDGLKEVLK